MKLTVTFKRDSKNVKKTMHLKNGAFLIYAPRQLKISPMQFERYDTEITVILPKNSYEYFTSKFKTDKIKQVCGDILSQISDQRNCSKKNKPFGFFVPETKGEINI